MCSRYNVLSIKPLFIYIYISFLLHLKFKIQEKQLLDLFLLRLIKINGYFLQMIFTF